MRLLAAKLALGPVLLSQGRRVRREAQRLPEPPGPRSGTAGEGTECVRVLLLGDSATAGVGADHQDHALAAPFARQLAGALGARSHRVDWTLLARSGVDTRDAIALLDAAAAGDAQGLRADVAVVGLGVNDVTGQVPVGRRLQALDALYARLRDRHGARWVVFSGLPPMHAFPALPQPLRWYLGACARHHDAALRRWAENRQGVLVVDLPSGNAAAMIASDGFHPGPAGYRAWAASLAAAVADAWRV